eukprot:CAMPEP_0114595650 /NCGR_PEP_ID=MMETSP0125-20121206/17526_1 /TAXON_ID=485358 ORGANISM="Aristerostoma sp., Strain ATCC 50986" /NCGR_SAMPLE_ID=MMETSP0125 /ASSEMBLY_ACC=CAM_ASM_000245 /LENGTH=47 /DNA_ID= /DNA_START= /DNA_END= /DNA_ORIENTATION=
MARSSFDFLDVAGDNSDDEEVGSNKRQRASMDIYPKRKNEVRKLTSK